MTATLDSSRRSNRFAIALCAALLVLVAAQYVFIFASVPVYYRLAIAGHIPTQTIKSDTFISQAMLVDAAAQRGMTLPTYIVYNLALNGLIGLGFWCVAGLVLWRARQDWFRWFTALVLAFYPSGGLWPIASAAYPVAAAYLDFLSLLWPGFLLFLYLFPNGRAVPRWSRWPMALILLVHLFVQALGYLGELPGHPVTLPAGVQGLFLVVPVGFVLILLCQVYRYLRAADSVTRKQIQWFVAAMALIGLSLLVDLASGSANSTSKGFSADFDNLSVLVIPVAITIAILRYRLWDIDVLIRRTLIYSVLTGLLALAYLGSVLVLQRLFQALTGQEQGQIVTVISTLAIAALFVPLRRRVQTFIDRRFYRRKYDAARILAAFGATAREDVNLDDLTGRLVSVVDETIEPSSVAVWLRGPRPRDR